MQTSENKLILLISFTVWSAETDSEVLALTGIVSFNV